MKERRTLLLADLISPVMRDVKRAPHRRASFLPLKAVHSGGTWQLSERVLHSRAYHFRCGHRADHGERHRLAPHVAGRALVPGDARPRRVVARRSRRDSHAGQRRVR